MLPVALIALSLAPLEQRIVIETADRSNETRVRVVALLTDSQADNLSEGRVSGDSGRNILRFGIVDNSNEVLTPMLGTYICRGRRLVFEPRFRLTPGQRYRAILLQPPNSRTSTDFKVPLRRSGPAPEVAAVYPSSEKLPANNLKFYICFSKPMRQGRAIFDQIALVDADGEVIHDPWRRTELWSDDFQRLTLWIHPGRIKQGVNLRESEGPVLRPDKVYALKISRSVRDAGGQFLAKSYVKTFLAVEDDRKRPRPASWDLDLPHIHTTEPLTIRFGESLDFGLLHRCLHVEHSDGREMKCTIEVGHGESVVRLRPAKRWNDAEYTLRVDAILEDLAGNTAVRQFDTDLEQAAVAPHRLTRSFRPQASLPERNSK